MAWLMCFGILLLTWTSWSGITLYKNYRAAKGIGLPIVVSPVRSLNPLWILSCTFLGILPWIQKLPEPLGRWSKYNYLGWYFDHGLEVVEKFGPAFVLVSPGGNEVIAGHPSLVNTVLGKRRDFPKPPAIYEILELFGRNLDSVDGETWQRHRKLTAPNFNERVSSLVWTESLRQSGEMLQEWVGSGARGTPEIAEDTATLALHVLTNAGLGIPYDFKDAHQKPVEPYQHTYRNALRIVLSNFLLLAIMPHDLLTARFMPKATRNVGAAIRDFKSYMREMVRSERANCSAQHGEAGNLLSALVRASEDAEKNGNDAGKGGQGLAEDEIYGNLFIYNLAGHETTANALAAAVAYLAATPRWQDWLAAEIVPVVGRDSNPSEWEYKDVFPRLRRCTAVMLETLRLHGSVVSIPRWTGPEPRTMVIAGAQHTIPSETFVTLNVQAVHSDPVYWGPDALEWRPDRWIEKSLVTGEEQLFEPAPGTFVPWADGPRICPGKKFSQVEFTAVMARVFRRHRVQPVLRENETAEDGRGRVQAMIRDSSIQEITLQIRNPKAVNLRWTEV